MKQAATNPYAIPKWFWRGLTTAGLTFMFFTLVLGPLYAIIIAPVLVAISWIVFFDTGQRHKRFPFGFMFIRSVILVIIIYAILVVRTLYFHSGQVGYGDAFQYGGGQITMLGYLGLFQFSLQLALPILLSTWLVRAMFHRPKSGRIALSKGITDEQ